MSSLWTPGGERPIGREPAAEAPSSASSAAQPTDEELRKAAEEYVAQLAAAPARVVVANHAVQLFELARIYLSQRPPKLDDASMAIDAMAALVEGFAGRLGEDEAQLKEGLATLRLAYVQIRSAAQRQPDGPGAAPS